MEDYKHFFKDKKITVMGLGLLGRGVGDVEFLAHCGAQVLVTDKKTEEQLSESIEKLRNVQNVTFRLGGHHIEDFTNCDMVIKAAGVPLDSLEIAAAKEAGVPVYMSTALFAKFVMEIGATIVGVTGTRGKSTVTHMIFSTLQKAGKSVHLGGNIRGRSTLAMLPLVKPADVVVLELDSWQLQGFGDLKISPHVAVFTNLLQDHQNYYSDMDMYFDDKANIFRYQKPENSLFVGHSLAERIIDAIPPGGFGIPASLPPDMRLKIPGEHNRENAALAAAALKELGIVQSVIRSGLESFAGVEGRLQFVREINGVKIYNDNNATTPDATIVALEALDPRDSARIVLLLGGSDKGLDIKALFESIGVHCKEVLLLAGTGTDSIRKEFPDAPVFHTLKQAVDAAVLTAAPGDIILFSPAFASFGMFKNEYDRNDQFLLLVASLV